MSATSQGAKADVVGGRFVDFLAKHNQGDSEFEASAKMNELIRLIRETKKQGSITLKFTFAPINGDPRKLLVTDTITVAEPKRLRDGSVFFSTEDGRLTRNNPDQTDFDEKLGMK